MINIAMGDTCTIDRFATNSNAILPRFNSYFYELGSGGVDCFAQTDFNDHINWMHPPFAVVNRCIAFLRRHYHLARCVLIVPYWSA